MSDSVSYGWVVWREVGVSGWIGWDNPRLGMLLVENGCIYSYLLSLSISMYKIPSTWIECMFYGR